MDDRALRIAFLLPTFPEISNTFTLTQITGLIDRGHHVDLFAIGRGSFEVMHADVAGYGLASRMRHLVVPKDRRLRIRSAVRLLVSPIGRHPAVIDALNPFRHAQAAWSLERHHTAASFVRAAPYDVLHCQFGHLGPAAERLRRFGALRARLVTSFRGADLTRHLQTHPRAYRDLFRHGDLFLPVSRDFRDRLVAFGAPADRIEVHHSGIDLRRFSFLPRRAPERAAEFLFVGRLTEKKGVADALEALGILLSNGRDARLTIIGDGALGPTLRRRCSELGIVERVTFARQRTQDEVLAALRVAHVMLVPSVTAANGDQEGIPNVAKEAMATGMPVVATRHSGIPELIEHGVSGLLAPERDPVALAALMSRLLDHPELWPAYGLAGRRRIEADVLAHSSVGIVSGRFVGLLSWSGLKAC